MSGFVKLHRSILEWEWYTDHNTCFLFMHLILTANYKPTKFQGKEIPAGSKVTGLNALAGQIPLTISQIRTSLKKLEGTGEIAIKKTNKFSIITIANWEKYQVDDKQIANKSHSNDKQIATSKEGKKERRKEYTACAEKPDGVSETVWGDFLTLRKAKKAAVTETAMKTIQREADKLGWSLERALSECCSRGWQGFKAEWVSKDQPQSAGVHWL